MALWANKPPVFESAGLIDALQTGGETLLRIPGHECHHGEIFAVGASSKSIEWSPIDAAAQSFDTQFLLRPKQTAQHEFVFVVTEFPQQHNRQWFRFFLQVAYSATDGKAEDEQQQVEVIVPGLPLPCCSETAQPIAAESKSCKSCGGNWEADAQPLPVTKNVSWPERREAAPTPPKELSPDQGKAESIIRPKK
jgi:hypothetical protein